MEEDKNTSARHDAFHTMAVKQALERLHSDREGLSSETASERLAATGPNRLSEPSPEPLLKRFFKHFHDMLIYVLLVSAVITALLKHWIDTGVILGVVLINAVIGFIQEGKAEQALAGIRKMLSPKARVRRDGTWQELAADQLVPGDVVRLRSGDRVPADLRLFETINLRIEESALTGESEPSEKQVEPVDDHAGIGDRSCMAYSGTLVAGGRGVGVVTATGGATEIGRITDMIADVEKLTTPLTRQMNRFGTVLSGAIVALALVLMLVGRLLHGFELTDLLFAAIGFAVAAIPEGLPAVLTITLALGVQRMAKHQAITRKLNAIETLGAVTVICSDKTGTLTKNEMTVREVVTAASAYEVTGTGYAPDGTIEVDDEQVSLSVRTDLQPLVTAMAVCNDSELIEEDGQWRVLGEPTEGALHALAGKAGFADEGYRRVDVIPFESENKFMATLNRFPDESLQILVKGASDRLLDRSRQQLSAEGTTEPLDRSFWEEQIEELSGQGLRVLAAAGRPAPDSVSDRLTMDDIDQELVFYGLVGIIDPPRPEAIEAIRICRQAGIRVKMITGDHAGTAVAIGREMGLLDGDGRAVEGGELEEASDETMRTLAAEYDIFARTSPEHKLRLVKALQANSEVVAMTGDGVNDAPALKRADVGVAMGIKGTEATKEAADIVLADDNFLSIERAVEEGRTIYDNLRKAILFILPTNGAEGLVILAAVLFGLVLPLTPVQILWVNMVTAVTLALALAFEPTEPGVMDRPPRQADEPILGPLLIWRIAFVSLVIGSATIAVFLLAGRWQMPIEQARTMAVNTLVFGQVFYLFNARFIEQSSLRLTLWFANPVVWLAVGLLLGFQVLFTHAPLMQLWFGSADLTLRDWLITVAIGCGVFLLVEGQKTVSRHFQRRRATA
ncbi:cation-translocating P-type ATPase [Desulfofustis glycolicus]|uniref:Plasma-membrane calcium-translocating P-type ATPase/potassium and/or sodium efflux P-type ATPase,TIGR01523 n=1 Tax=Desulfofustis glycolicus DSM 9705 TaxID=1121409 RepID=A0A1M5XZJ7_9BACT|nr:cation-transporting P-type ATPase [Desulfofustis glycolicus]SHI04968.1 plasma-membrane calcium-translocating P-type ATPase/potassium and/or sodium efflux P-type ATPase,TIGR01523 [Desulfofustis glycolicus DSM 9705]